MLELVALGVEREDGLMYSFVRYEIGLLSCGLDDNIILSIRLSSKAAFQSIG